MFNTPRSRRIVFAVLFVVLLTLITLTPAFASERITGDDITVDEDIDDDLYVFGQNITVNSTIDGDLIAFGQSLTLNGTVTGDLIFGGQWLVVNGTVEDDLRAGGMNLILRESGTVGDDVNVGASAFEMEPGSHVGGDVFFGTSQAVLGDIDGDVAGGGTAARINGEIGGNAELAVSGEGPVFNPAMFMNDPTIPTVSTIASGLSFGSDGSIAGDLSLVEPSPAEVPEGVVAGSITRVAPTPAEEGAEAPAEGPRFSPAVRYSGSVIGSFIVLLVVGSIGLRLAPNFFHGTLNTLRARALPSLGMGVLAYIVVYVILPILAILFIALLVIPLAGVGDRLRGAFGLLGLGTWTGFRLVTRWIAPVIAALLVGGVLDRALNKNREKPSTLVPLVLGLVVMAILLAIPIVGRWLLASLVGMFGLGAMILYLRSGGMRVDAAPVAPPAAVPASGPAADQPTV